MKKRLLFLILAACGKPLDPGLVECPKIKLGDMSSSIATPLSTNDVCGGPHLNDNADIAGPAGDMICCKDGGSSCAVDCTQAAYENLTFKLVGGIDDDNHAADWCCVVLQNDAVVARYQGYD